MAGECTDGVSLMEGKSDAWADYSWDALLKLAVASNLASVRVLSNFYLLFYVTAVMSTIVSVSRYNIPSVTRDACQQFATPLVRGSALPVSRPPRIRVIPHAPPAPRRIAARCTSPLHKCTLPLLIWCDPSFLHVWNGVSSAESSGNFCNRIPAPSNSRPGPVRQVFIRKGLLPCNAQSK